MLPTSADLPSLVASCSAFVDRAIDDAVTEKLAETMAGMRGALFPAVAAAPVRAKAARRPRRATRTTAPVTVAPTARRVRLCPVPGCGKPAAGPRYHWRCREHGAAPGLKAAVTAAALPAPKAATATGASRAQCRVPGCPTKNSGPRFEFFCREHYAALNSAERAKMKAAWKAAHAAATA